MKLLETNKLQEIKNQERLVEMKSGAFLASKVDDLRKRVLTEEGNLDTLQNKTIPYYQSIVGKLIEDKTIIESEVINLRNERIELLKPLDEKKEELQNFEKVLESINVNLKSFETELMRLQKKLLNRETKLGDLKKKLEQYESQLNARELKIKEVEQYQSELSQSLQEREANILEQEQRNQVRQEELERYNAGLQLIAEENKKEKTRLKQGFRKLQAQEMIYGNRPK